MVGTDTEVLLDGMSKKPDMANGGDHENGAGLPGGESWQGRDPYGQPVNVVLPARPERGPADGPEGWLGRIVPVTIVEAKKHSLRGVLRA